jgi:hypothetical protein
MDLFSRTLIAILLLCSGINPALAQDPNGDVGHGKTLFQ